MPVGFRAPGNHEHARGRGTPRGHPGAATRAAPTPTILKAARDHRTSQGRHPYYFFLLAPVSALALRVYTSSQDPKGKSGTAGELALAVI